MTHLIYLYVIVACILISRDLDTEYNFKTNFARGLLLLFFPLLFLYILFYKVYENDYIFFIRVLFFKYKIENSERLIYNIEQRRIKKSKLWNYLADKVIKGLNS